MQETGVLTNYYTLPPDAQQQVADFISFLQTRYKPVSNTHTKPKIKLADEEFIGMWRDRKDMEDSTEWVRKIRKTEWGQLNE